jgi:outer membrane protein OmpA-like peptidoglycan-associated protein
VQGLLLDEKGDRSNRSAIVTLTTSEGEFIGNDARPDQPGFQVEAREGQFTALLRSGLTSGNSIIRASSVINNLEFEAFTQLQLETNLRPSILTGIVDFRIGARGTDFYRSFRDFLPTDGNNSTNVDFYAAAFGTGKVGEWLITGAFNTRRTLNEDCEGRSRLFRDIQFCKQNYPVYGDSSTLTTETPSLTSIFLRAERTSPVPNAGTDFLMWGDFRTEEFASRSQEFTAFTRQFNGLKFNYNFGDLQATGLYSTTTRGFERDIIPPDGTSGFFFLSRRLVTPGSENVFIESEELLRPGNIVRRVKLNRSQDYEIDYDRGSLQFRQPILKTDIGAGGETLVRRIIVSYEYDNEGGTSNGSNNNSVYAGQLRYHFKRELGAESWLGVNYFKENQGARDFQLYGANALVSFGKNSYVIAEYARSQNNASDLPAPVSGSALRFEAVSEFVEGIIAKAFYRQTDTGFVNNATISFVPGQTRLGLSIDAKVSDATTIRASYEREENRGIAPQPFTLDSFLSLTPQSTPGNPVDNQLSTLSLGVLQKLGSATAELDFLLRDRQDRLNTTFSGASSQLRSRLTVPILENLKFIAQNEISLSNSPDTVLPDRTALVLDWQPIEGISLRVGQQWFSSGVLAGSSFTTGEVVGNYKVFPDTTLSGRYTLVGGANTTTQGAIGLNQRWVVFPGLRVEFGYERIFGNDQVRNSAGVTQVLQPLTTGSNTSSLALQSGDNYSIGFEYTDNPDFKASARYEYRISSAGANSVINASALGKISPSITGLLRYQRSGIANQTINNFGDTSSLRLGLAYRDPANDALNALLRYEYRQNPSSIPESFIGGIGSGSEEHVLALEAIYSPNWQWEFYGKYALRNNTSYLAQDLIGTSAINLAQLRATYRLGYNFDVSAEGRLINQPTAGFNEVGFVTELGYYATPNLRFALGYSSGAVNNDRDFSGTRSAGGIYAAVTFKLNELFDGFGLQKIAPPQQKEPLDPSVAIELPVNPKKAGTTTASFPSNPSEVVRVSLAQPVEFPKSQVNLSPINQLVLDNLVTVLREYPALNIDVQGHLASLTEASANSPDAQRLGKVRSYLMRQGIDGGRITMRSLGAPEIDDKPQVLLALGGTRETFTQISDRIKQGNGSSILQNVLPSDLSSVSSNSPVASSPLRVQAISQRIEFAPVGKMTDPSNANLDLLISRIVNNPEVAVELQGNLDGSELEVNRLMGLRSYLIQKGIASDRILISPANSDTANSNTANSITLTLANLEGVPIAQLPNGSTPARTIAQQNNDNRLSLNLSGLNQSGLNLGELTISSSSLLSQLLDPENYRRQLIGLLPSPQLLTMLLEPQAQPTLLSTNFSTFLSGFPLPETAPRWSSIPSAQILSLLFPDPNAAPERQPDLIAEDTKRDSNTRRLVSALNFLLSRDRDVLTALLRSLNESQPELRGEIIRPELFEEGKP